MEQGEQDGSGERQFGPSPGAQRAAREQVERQRREAEEREREMERRAEERARAQQAQQYAPHPPAPYGPPPAGGQHPAPPSPQQGWSAWQQRPSQPSQQVAPPVAPQQQAPPPAPTGQQPAPPPPPQPYQQASYPAYQQPPPGWTPYGYAPVPYGQPAPQPWPQAAPGQQQLVTAAPDEHPKELPWQLAGWWNRVGAQLIDVLIVWVPCAIVLTVLILLADGASNGSATETALVVVAIVATFVALAIHLFYAPLLMKRKGGRNGQTWGKQICNIRVIRADGKEMRFSDAALRQIIFKSFGMLVASTFVPLFPWILNYLWPTWDEQHRALHDLAADTRVVAA